LGARRECFAEDFFSISFKFLDALDFNDSENNQTFKERRGMKKISHFFTSDTTMNKHRMLYNELNLFHHDNNPEEIDSDDLKDVLAKIRANFSILPGHLQTLAKEVLNRGDALANFVEHEASHSAKSVLNNH
jgi:hypothetical protein